MNLLDRLNVFKRISVIEQVIPVIKTWLLDFYENVNGRFEQTNHRVSILEASKPWESEINRLQEQLAAANEKIYRLEIGKEDRKMTVSSYNLTLKADLDGKAID